jgi:hypothetical protein
MDILDFWPPYQPTLEDFYPHGFPSLLPERPQPPKNFGPAFTEVLGRLRDGVQDYNEET